MGIVEQPMDERMPWFVPEMPIAIDAEIRTSWAAKDIVRMEGNA